MRKKDTFFSQKFAKCTAVRRRHARLSIAYPTCAVFDEVLDEE